MNGHLGDLKISYKYTVKSMRNLIFSHDVSDLGYGCGVTEINELNSNQRPSSHLVVGPISCRVGLGNKNSLAFDTS